MINTILLLSIVGIIDSIYLSIKHYTLSAVNCSIFEGCELVTTSSYSTVFSVPVALLGIIFYAFIFSFALMFLKSKSNKSLILLLTISSIGFIVSMWFVYVQVFILHAFCFYCLISASLSTTIFILNLIAVIKYKNAEKVLRSI
jgi:uncharacterized membrane protein